MELKEDLKKKNHTHYIPVENNHPSTHVWILGSLNSTVPHQSSFRIKLDTPVCNDSLTRLVTWLDNLLRPTSRVPGQNQVNEVLCTPLICHFGWDGFGSADAVPQLGYSFVCDHSFVIKQGCCRTKKIQPQNKSNCVKKEKGNKYPSNIMDSLLPTMIKISI